MCVCVCLCVCVCVRERESMCVCLCVIILLQYHTERTYGLQRSKIIAMYSNVPLQISTIFRRGIEN